VCDIRRHRYDGHNPAAEGLRAGIRAVIAHNYDGSPLVGLRTSRWLQVGNANLAAPHEWGSPSATVDSHSSVSPESSHSCHASS
jgi:hypothetical protein